MCIKHLYINIKHKNMPKKTKWNIKIVKYTVQLNKITKCLKIWKYIHTRYLYLNSVQY